MKEILQIMQQKFDALSKEQQQLENMNTDWTDEQLARAVEIEIKLEQLEHNMQELDCVDSRTNADPYWTQPWR